MLMTSSIWPLLSVLMAKSTAIVCNDFHLER